MTARLIEPVPWSIRSMQYQTTGPLLTERSQSVLGHNSTSPARRQNCWNPVRNLHTMELLHVCL